MGWLIKCISGSFLRWGCLISKILKPSVSQSKIFKCWKGKSLLIQMLNNRRISSFLASFRVNSRLFSSRKLKKNKERVKNLKSKLVLMMIRKSLGRSSARKNHTPSIFLKQWNLVRQKSNKKLKKNLILLKLKRQRILWLCRKRGHH